MRIQWVVVLACVALLACNSGERGQQPVSGDVEEDAGGDAGVENDASGVTGALQGQAVSFAVSGGVVQSPSFRFEYTLAAPLVTGPASSQGFVTLPVPAGTAPAGAGE